MSNVLARRVFYSLERSTFYPGLYLVLNDRNHVASFHAASDADAIRIFETGEYKK